MVDPVPDVEADAALAALDDLVVAIERTQRSLEDAVARAEELRGRRLAGQPYREIVATDRRPLVEVVSSSTNRLIEAGSRFRRAQARALRAEGLTMEAIADLFGVTRQRVSHLLNSGASGGTEPITEPATRPATRPATVQLPSHEGAAQLPQPAS
ncbi:MAG: hypothetical protein ACJ74O_20670 [Frankiaceae bacterium]